MARVRRLFGIRKAGHIGTLDPFAEGVLPICLARATAAVQFMESYGKTYRVRFRIGKATDTQDLTGTVVEVKTPSEEQLGLWLAGDGQYLRDAVAGLRGRQLQTPPIYSALKLDGRPLYSYARAGEEVDLSMKTREIEVKDAVLEGYRLDPDEDPEAPLELTALISCSKGTYIRTLVHDLGVGLGSAAVCTALIRTAVGPYTMEESVTLAELESAMTEDPAEHPALEGLDRALAHFPVLELDHTGQVRFVQGQFLPLPPDFPTQPPEDSADGDRQVQESRRLWRAVGPDGLVGLAYVRQLPDGSYRLAAERVFARNNE